MSKRRYSTMTATNEAPVMTVAHNPHPAMKIIREDASCPICHGNVWNCTNTTCQAHATGEYLPASDWVFSFSSRHPHWEYMSPRAFIKSLIVSVTSLVKQEVNAAKRSGTKVTDAGWIGEYNITNPLAAEYRFLLKAYWTL